MHSTRARHVMLAILLVAGVFFLLAIVTTWPLVLHLDTVLLDRADDTPLHYWNGWWVQHALQHDNFVYYCPLLCYPNGVSLITHNIAWGTALPWAALEPWIGGLAAYNLVLIIGLALCGCAACALVYDLTHHMGAALVAGVIYQAWPYRMAQLDHPNLISTQFIPLFILFLIRLLRDRRWRDALGAGVCFALVGYTRWQLLIPALLMALTYTLMTAREWWTAGRWRTVLWGTLAVGVAAAALSLPASLLIWQQTSEHEALLIREGEEETMQTDLLAYVTPNARHPVLGKWTAPLYKHYYPDQTDRRRYPAYVGLLPMLLMIVAVARTGKRSLPWLAMIAILGALALGPTLRINGRFYPSAPMPYRILAPTLIFRLMRAPTRFNMFLALPVAVLAGQGIAAWGKRPNGQGWRSRLIVGAIASLVIFEYLAIPLPLRTVEEPSPWLQQIAQEPDDYALLNLPIDSLQAKEYMFDQITHGRPIMQGNVSRMPGNAFDAIRENPWLCGRWPSMPRCPQR